MYQELLKEVEKDQARFGAALQPPCSRQQIDELRSQVRHQLKTELPQEYAEFLSLTNGLDWGGLAFFACEKTPIAGHADRHIQGFVDMNLNYRDNETLRDYLVFGEGNMDLYAYQISTGEYQILDRVPLEVVNKPPSFDSLMSEALKSHIL